MLLVIAALALLVSVPLAGGRLTRLAEIEPRGVWAVLLAVAIQVGISDVAPGGSHGLHAGLNVLSYLLDAYFIFANRRLAGVPLVAIGAALNVLAITTNGGVMPANAVALRTAGIDGPRRLRQLGGAGPPAPGLPGRRLPGARAVAGRQRPERRRPHHPPRRARPAARELPLAPGLAPPASPRDLINPPGSDTPESSGTRAARSTAPRPRRSPVCPRAGPPARPPRRPARGSSRSPRRSPLEPVRA